MQNINTNISIKKYHFESTRVLIDSLISLLACLNSLVNSSGRSFERPKHCEISEKLLWFSNNLAITSE